jgi:biopolymer transport protein TolQ
LTPPLGLFLLVGQLGPLLYQTGWVARGVLVILFGFSLFSWAVIIQKFRLFTRLHADTAQFLNAFRASRQSAAPKTVAAHVSGSPLAKVYAAGIREVESQLATANPHPGKLKSHNAVASAMQVASADEIRGLEKWMPWLATTGSVAPFIGLFGTVWGVIDAFAGLGDAGAASLRVVAPGIAEALITTAAGLATAVPAVIAYNHFLHLIKDLAGQMDTFATEFVSLLEKTYG